MKNEPVQVDRFPSVTRDDVGCVVISPWFTGDETRQRHTADAVVDAWDALAAWPDGLVSLNCFTSVDGEALLLYIQWTDESVRAAFAAGTAVTDGGFTAFGPAQPVRYRVYRSLSSGADAAVPTSLITATFDVDGPERQRHIADVLCEAAESIPPHPAGIGSHFHLSWDGTRVLNYTEWNDDAAHDVMMDSGAFDEIYRLSTETPGVRATRGRHYHLYRALRSDG